MLNVKFKRINVILYVIFFFINFIYKKKIKFFIFLAIMLKQKLKELKELKLLIILNIF